MGRRAVLSRLLLLLLLGILLLSNSVLAGADHYAGLVVRFGDGSTYTECVSFGEESITGAQVLQRSALSVVTQAGPMGVAVCKIGSEGCNYPAEPCFCKCEGGQDCFYWAYYHLKNGKWEYSPVGAGSYHVHDGDVEGWAWGSGTFGSSGAQPPHLTFDEICATPTATATATPLPTLTPSSAARPTDTPVPPPTATPTPVPTFTSTPVPFSVSFAAIPDRIAAGECASLQWDVEGVRAVYLDGSPVTGHEERKICPRQKTTYTLRMELPGGSVEIRRVTVDVLAPAATPVPTVSPSAGLPRRATTTPSPTAVPFSATATPTPVPPTATPLPCPTPTPTAMITATTPVPLPTAPKPASTVAEESGGSAKGKLLAYGVFAVLAGVLLALLGIRGMGGHG